VDLEFLASLCRAGPIEAAEGGTLFASLFLAGLTGSTVHCTAMCGPFVLAQIGDRLAAAPRFCEITRLQSALLLPYHLGRLVTYAGLGAIAAGLGGTLQHLPWLSWLSGLLLFVGAGLFAAQGFKAVAGGVIGPGAWGHRLAALSSRLDRTRWSGTLALGLLLGFLPCGFLYAALAVAASAAQPATGALAMAAFAFGTVPSLIAIGIAGHVAGSRLRAAARWASPAVALVNAALLLALAWHRAFPA
jgi:hypothetical protein